MRIHRAAGAGLALRVSRSRRSPPNSPSALPLTSASSPTPTASSHTTPPPATSAWRCSRSFPTSAASCPGAGRRRGGRHPEPGQHRLRRARTRPDRPGCHGRRSAPHRDAYRHHAAGPPGRHGGRPWERGELHRQDHVRLGGRPGGCARGARKRPRREGTGDRGPRLRRAGQHHGLGPDGEEPGRGVRAEPREPGRPPDDRAQGGAGRGRRQARDAERGPPGRPEERRLPRRQRPVHRHPGVRREGPDRRAGAAARAPQAALLPERAGGPAADHAGDRGPARADPAEGARQSAAEVARGSPGVGDPDVPRGAQELHVLGKLRRARADGWQDRPRRARRHPEEAKDPDHDGYRPARPARRRAARRRHPLLRASPRPLDPVLHRDVGALQLLRHARAPDPVHDGPGRDRAGLGSIPPRPARSTRCTSARFTCSRCPADGSPTGCWGCGRRCSWAA